MIGPLFLGSLFGPRSLITAQSVPSLPMLPCQVQDLYYKYNLPRFLLLSFHFCFDFEGTIRKGKRMAGTSEAPPLPEGNSDDKLVKLAVAISLIRSKLTEKQPQPPQPQPPPPAEPEALRWKRKVVSSLCICSRKWVARDYICFRSFSRWYHVNWMTIFQAKERKLELLRLREDLKEAEG